ncbi:hypothetical protein Verru16b_01095 [Lacunisphaera limnophila]|uniref:Ice-binding protein C-terminal domain-containing protein n=1 Tax=Lacunisphaera limnophila TaxID=1838286 RepID=A0A1D8AT08_9BACT|nr:PEP-CTERM sorting domain-containing protein [Lacunisphaera limnophila]AOS44034.1 hypothetical protein Verru16b_01095 [Lacunisphaera limnophila]
MKLRLLTLLTGFLLAVLPLSAQVFLGSDDFNDNTLTLDSLEGEQPGIWSFSIPRGSGAWTETNQRMEYTNSNVNFNNTAFLARVDTRESTTAVGGAGLSAGNPFNSNWTAQVTATNTMTAITAGSTMAGIETFTRPGDAVGSNSYYGIYLQTAPGATNLQFEWGSWNGSAWVRTSTFASTVDTSDVLLRMTFDATTKNLLLDYSFNAGATFTTGATFDLDGAEAGPAVPYGGGMAIELAVTSRATGSAITAGQITFDNFAVTAIPEPSTYAAFAGLGALGLVLWRRRQAKSSS